MEVLQEAPDKVEGKPPQSDRSAKDQSESGDKAKPLKKSVARGGTKKIRSIRKRPLAQQGYMGKLMNFNFDYIIDKVQYLFSKPPAKKSLLVKPKPSS